MFACFHFPRNRAFIYWKLNTQKTAPARLSASVTAFNEINVLPLISARLWHGDINNIFSLRDRTRRQRQGDETKKESTLSSQRARGVTGAGGPSLARSLEFWNNGSVQLLAKLLHFFPHLMHLFPSAPLNSISCLQQKAFTTKPRHCSSCWQQALSMEATHSYSSSVCTRDKILRWK